MGNSMKTQYLRQRLLLVALAGVLLLNSGCGIVMTGLARGAFDEQVRALPSVAVRIENLTTSSASVELSAGMTAPPYFGGIFLPWGFLLPQEDYKEEIAYETVNVSAEGTATGSIKCGEVIAIAASAPITVSERFFAYDGESFGFYAYPGNLAVSGFGSPPEETFSGDIQSGTRFIRPVEDSMDCSADTLVIRIETAAQRTVYDPSTGELVSEGTPGSAIISLETP